jgi:hypothetical protein
LEKSKWKETCEHDFREEQVERQHVNMIFGEEQVEGKIHQQINGGIAVKYLSIS